MAQTIDIAGVKHVVTDFRHTFTARQLRKALTLLSGLLAEHGSVASLLRGGRVAGEQIVEIINASPAILEDARLYELMAVFFIPEGEKYSDDTLAKRAEVMIDAPLGELVGAVKDFFAGRTSVAASSSDTSTPATP